MFFNKLFVFSLKYCYYNNKIGEIMDINNFEQAFKNSINLIQVTETEWKINCGASFINHQPMDIRLIKVNDKWYFSDKKQTLRYMNDLYELNSNDVKSCISNVLKIYGFSIQSGSLMAEIPTSSDILDKFFDYIMCVAQLANMYAFFDEPK